MPLAVQARHPLRVQQQLDLVRILRKKQATHP
jgi:hypothetical protein